ncbi:histidine phosphatase family protein [Leptolyngbya sp. NK1-12]|uniref:Histidine phosphatase family protein n=1 Tax=Leptolyngbya sp. NK1-12 TaxID=2547451 RepID=A0AA96WU32_9CYAN|nr:histidine phosphatase family protein [Leptolyngbya sp. NK1-12]
MQSLHKTIAFITLAITLLIASGCKDSSSDIPQSSTTPTAIASPSLVRRGSRAVVQRGSRAASPTPSSSPTTSEATLWNQLRQGKGYVLLLRHALAPGTGDPANFRLDDCSTQRNLSTEGQQQAIRIGEILRQQNIPVSRVLSSQWCRCLETARLMSVGPVEPFPVLNSFFQDRSSEQAQTEQLRQFILENRDNAGVIVMVTHQVNITAISTIVPQSGSAIVMRAISPEQIELIGQLDSF